MKRDMHSAAAEHCARERRFPGWEVESCTAEGQRDRTLGRGSACCSWLIPRARSTDASLRVSVGHLLCAELSLSITSPGRHGRWRLR